MSLVVLGVNHATAKLALRERWSYQAKEVVTTLKNLSNKLNVEEIALLSTCNRTEIYCDIKTPYTLLQWFSREVSPRTAIDINQHGYFYQDQKAITHIMRVACGLDSLVLGEPQILGQFKQAYKLAKTANTVGKKFNQLFDQAFSAAKNVRTYSDIGLHATSIASASINLVLSNFETTNPNKLGVLLIGSGDTIKTVGKSLIQKNIIKLSIANHNKAHAKDLAEYLIDYTVKKFNKEINIKTYDLTIANEPKKLAQYNTIFTATSSPIPILNKKMIKKSIGDNNKAKLLLIDLSVPRDIDNACSELEQVYLYNIDDLKIIIDNNSMQRQNATKQAEEIVNDHVNEFCSWERSLTLISSLCQYRQQAEIMCQDVINKANKRIGAGHDIKEILIDSLQLLRKKLIHHPTITLKSLAKDKNIEIDLIKDLFNL